MGKNSIELLKVARERIDNYVDMGHFRDPKEATPYLVDGFQLGYRHAEKEIAQERDSLLEKLKTAEETLEFYADKSSWSEVAADMYVGFIKYDDFDQYDIGGRRARECLQKLRGEG